MERLFPTLLLTRAVAEVEKLIEEDGVEKTMRFEELVLQQRRRWEAKASEGERKKREQEEAMDWRRRFYGY